MQVTETLSDGLKRGFTVVVPAADIESKRSKRLAELGKTVRLPGFRPGRVPPTVVKQRYGGAVTAEVLEESVNEATNRVLNERGLRSATQPKVELVSIEEKRDLEFRVEVELLPEIAVPALGEIALTRLKCEPGDEVIERALGEMAKRLRKLEEVEELRPAVTGDVLTVDFTGRVDGTAFPGGTGTGVDVEVGGPGFIPGFTEQLEGMVAGETRMVAVTFPDPYAAPDLAGKAAEFEVTAKTLKRVDLPVIDDAFAETLGFEGKLAELKQAVTAQVQREYDQMSRLRIKRDLLDALAERAAFPVPPSMVEGEFAQIWQRLEADRKAGRVDADDAGKDDETLKGEYRAIAERRVRLGLLLSEIGRANGIVVSADEMNRAIRAEAGRYPGQEAKVFEFFRKNPQAAESVRGPIFEEKVIDFVLELANVTDRVVSPEELAADPGMPAAIRGVGEPAALVLPSDEPAAEVVTAVEAAPSDGAVAEQAVTPVADDEGAAPEGVRADVTEDAAGHSAGAHG